MSMFSHEARQFKFDVLKEVSELAYEGNLTEESAGAISRKLIPGRKAEFRCCVYKEREILRQRTRLACGKMADESAEHNPRQIVQVIDAACDGCTIRKIQITDNCRKCMAKACLAACKFDAISMGAHRAQIDYDKCRECGACARSCPYNAIVVTERPCSQHCPVGAIHWDENGIAQIDESKCINCGACRAACPFGAIEDISWIVPVINDLKKGVPTYAIIAPAIQGQFSNATLPQIKKSIEMLGFEKVYEVALGADAVTWEEQKELAEKMEKGEKMTTSCCPAFVNLERMHFPEIYENNMSTVVSPMVALARKLKKDHPDHHVVFIGPCIAKKQESMDFPEAVDSVLTFEEVAAMMISRHINPTQVEAQASEYPSVFGRNFAQGGGVSKAVAQVAKEKNMGGPVAVYADGCAECKKQLTLMKFNRFNGDILEGMSCVGGCIAGPAVIEPSAVSKGRMSKENMSNKQTISESLEKFDFSDVPLHRHIEH